MPAIPSAHLLSEGGTGRCETHKRGGWHRSAPLLQASCAPATERIPQTPSRLASQAPATACSTASVARTKNRHSAHQTLGAPDKESSGGGTYRWRGDSAPGRF